jgi:hypothetical protein
MTRPRQLDSGHASFRGPRGYLVEQARQELGPQMFNESQASARRAAALVRQAAIDPDAPDVAALRDALQQIDARQRRQDLKAASAAMSDARDWTADANTDIDFQELQERRGVTGYQHRLPSHAEVHAQREQYQDIHDALHQATEQANQRADELADANKAREDDMSVTDYRYDAGPRGFGNDLARLNTDNPGQAFAEAAERDAARAAFEERQAAGRAADEQRRAAGQAAYEAQQEARAREVGYASLADARAAGGQASDDYPYAAPSGSAAWATQQLMDDGYDEAQARWMVNNYLAEVEQRSGVPAAHLGMGDADIAEARQRLTDHAFDGLDNDAAARNLAEYQAVHGPGTHPFDEPLTAAQEDAAAAGHGRLTAEQADEWARGEPASRYLAPSDDVDPQLGPDASRQSPGLPQEHDEQKDADALLAADAADAQARLRQNEVYGLAALDGGDPPEDRAAVQRWKDRYREIQDEQHAEQADDNVDEIPQGFGMWPYKDGWDYDDGGEAERQAHERTARRAEQEAADRQYLEDAYAENDRRNAEIAAAGQMPPPSMTQADDALMNGGEHVIRYDNDQVRRAHEQEQRAAADAGADREPPLNDPWSDDPWIDDTTSTDRRDSTDSTDLIDDTQENTMADDVNPDQLDPDQPSTGTGHYGENLATGKQFELTSDEVAAPTYNSAAEADAANARMNGDDSGQDDRRQQPGDATDRDSGNLPIGPAGDPDPYVYDTAYETHEEAMARLGLEGGSPKQQRLIDEANARTADEAEKARDDAADADAASASAALALAQGQQRDRGDDYGGSDDGRGRDRQDDAVAVAE